MTVLHGDPQEPFFRPAQFPSVLTTGPCLAGISFESQPPVAAEPEEDEEAAKDSFRPTAILPTMPAPVGHPCRSSGPYVARLQHKTGQNTLC